MYISYSCLILANFFIIKHYQWSILNSPISTNARSLYSVHFQNIQITARLKSHIRWRSWGLIMLVALALLFNSKSRARNNVNKCHDMYSRFALYFSEWFSDMSNYSHLAQILPILLKNPKSRLTCYVIGEISILTSILTFSN